MIIGLVGFIGSGKGTVSDMLVEQHGFLKESFAGGVKDAVAVIFGWDRALLEGDTEYSRLWRETPDPQWSEMFGYEVVPRRMLQLMGTEAGRDVFHKNLWIYNMRTRCHADKNYVIADVRFPNEIAEIKKLGGKIIRVKRGPEPAFYELARKINAGEYPMSEMYTQFPDVHYSEWAWIGTEVDVVINNDSDKEELAKSVNTVLYSIFN